MEKKLGVLVGAAPLGRERVSLEKQIAQKNTYTVAVDGGIAFFLDHMYSPDYWLGDMDSFKENDVLMKYSASKSFEAFLAGIPSSVVSPVKDDTDMDLAVQHALENGSDEILIYGGSGGNRISHTLANIQLLMRFAQKGIRITLVSERHRIFVLYNESMKFSETDQGFISIFSLSDISEGVKIKGLLYEYEGSLTNDKALGVSNQFCGKEAMIAVQNGALLIVHEE